MMLAHAVAVRNINSVTADKYVSIKQFIVMKKTLALLFSLSLFSAIANAQVLVIDTVGANDNFIQKDERIDLLGDKMIEYNRSLSKKTKLVNGFRLMVLNTTDRKASMQLRAALLQKFPDQKVYTTFLAPYIKLKFGNYLNREDANKMKSQLESLKIVSGNIYVTSEMIEIKPSETPGYLKD